MIVDVGHFADPGLEFCEEIKQRHPHQKVLMQVDGHIYLGRETCPDKVVSKQEGPSSFCGRSRTVAARFLAGVLLSVPRLPFVQKLDYIVFTHHARAFKIAGGIEYFSLRIQHRQ